MGTGIFCFSQNESVSQTSVSANESSSYIEQDPNHRGKQSNIL